MTQLRPPTVPDGAVLVLRSPGPAVWSRWPLVACACARLIGQAGAADWYVDNAAVNSPNTGRSWAEAWTNFASVVWGQNGVKAGDTLFISGGTTGKVYTEIWSVGADGTSNAPIRIALDAANTNHNGPVIFDYDHLGDYARVSALLCLRDHVTFDGNVNGQRHLIFRNLRNITNGFGPECIVADGTRGVVVDHVAFTNCNAPVRLIYGTQFRVSHCEFRAVRGEAAILAAGCSGGWDANLIYSNTFELLFNTNAPPGVAEEYFGPDGIQCGDGVSIFGNVFREVAVTDRYTSTQHPDFIQTVGNFTKIYNNEFINIGDSAIDRGLYSGTVVDGVWIYNNVFRIEEPIDGFPEFIRIYNGAPTLIRDVRICNNTFVDNPDWISIRLSNYGVPVAYSNAIQNNIFYRCGGGRFRPVIHFEDTCAFTTNSFEFDANIYVGASNLQAYIIYGSVFPASVWTRTFETRGKTNAPQFRFYSPYHPTNDLRLADSDTAAAGAGLDLSAWFQTDKDGSPRPVGAPWSIGAYEHPGGAPIITGAPPEVSAISQDVPDADPFAPGLQVLAGTTARYLGQIPGQAPVFWEWLYSQDERPDIVHQSGVGAVAPASFAYASNMIGSVFVWKLRAYNGPLWAESQLLVEVIAAAREPTNGVFEAELGAIEPPFLVEDGAVGQGVKTSAGNGGRAVYSFSVDRAGDYLIRARVNAPFFQQRSVYVNVDAEPVEEQMTWPIPLTAGFEEQIVSWLGNGTCIDPEFAPKVFRLEAGTHQLIVRGHEPNVRLDRFAVMLVLPEVVTLEATNGLGSSVFVTGQVNPLGTETRAYFEYGLTTDYGATTTVTNVGSGGEPVNLRARLGGLMPGSVYHYRLVAYNGNGTNFGADRVFVSGTPRLRAPTFQDGRFAVNVSTVSNWVYFLQRQSPLNGGNWITVTNCRGNGSTQTLVDAQPPPGACFYRVQAGPLPVVESWPPAALFEQFVLLSGRVNPFGLPAFAFFEYGTTTNYGTRTTAVEFSPNQGLTTISNLLTGLDAEVLYHFRLVAWNTNGTNWSDGHALIPGPLKMQSVRFDSGVFSVEIPTRTNRWYWLEYTTNLSNPVWLSVTAFVGDGTLRTFTEIVGDAPARFYRVRCMLPTP